MLIESLWDTEMVKEITESYPPKRDSIVNGLEILTMVAISLFQAQWRR